MKNPFKSYHITATKEDLEGNNGVGRYILLPGSDGRAKQIAEHFHQCTVKKHPRGHHLYLGSLKHKDRTIDIATIASGMGCPSMEIILHELFHLGGKRFLRIGTAGSLQSEIVKIGHIVNAQAAVRDEATTADYVPSSVPAIASLEFNSAILQAAKQLKLDTQMHTGIVHCKSSFYAREFGAGPLGEANLQFIDLLARYGVLATEMETAALFIQSHFYNHTLKQQGDGKAYQVLSGAILGILATLDAHFADADETNLITNNLIHLGLETIKVLSDMENNY